MEDQNFTPPPVPPVPPVHDPSMRGSSEQREWHEASSRDYANDVPPMKPNNWLWQSILATILCCIVFGIVGIIYATKVDSLYYKGQYEEAERAAKKAKTWTLIAVAFALVYLVVWLLLLLTGNLPDYMNEIIENSISGYNF